MHAANAKFSQKTDISYRTAAGVVLDEVIPTVTDTLFARGAIPANVYSLGAFQAFLSFIREDLSNADSRVITAALQPITDDNGGANVVGAGTLTFGGPNEEDFIGPLK